MAAKSDLDRGMIVRQRVNFSVNITVALSKHAHPLVTPLANGNVIRTGFLVVDGCDVSGGNEWSE